MQWFPKSNIIRKSFLLLSSQRVEWSLHWGGTSALRKRSVIVRGLRVPTEVWSCYNRTPANDKTGSHPSPWRWHRQRSIPLGVLRGTPGASDLWKVMQARISSCIPTAHQRFLLPKMMPGKSEEKANNTPQRKTVLHTFLPEKPIMGLSELTFLWKYFDS